MGIENLLEDGAGIFAAEKGLEAVDPNAGLLAKGAAAVAAVMGVGEIKSLLGGGDATPAADDSAPQDDSNS